MTDTSHGHEPRLPLVLGTAQLGMNYGIANKRGKPDFENAMEIVKAAFENGVKFFDTAQAYGDSETVLGKCFQELHILNNDEEPLVITKLDPKINLRDADEIYRKVEDSLEKLGLKKLWGLMLHRESILDRWGNTLTQIISKLKLENKIEHFGISVYSPEKAKEALHKEEIDIIQLPFNVFDQRALDYGVFSIAEEKNKKVFIRSVYLQGLLISKPNQLSDKMRFSKKALKKYIDFAKEYEISPKLLALAFVIQNAPDQMIVMGAENSTQVQENISLLTQARRLKLPDLKYISTHNTQLINPSLWPQ